MSDIRDPERDQPLPAPGQQSVQAVLIRALAERRDYGIRKYGRPLETHNGRDALVDAWEELLDGLSYLTQLRLERGDHIAEEATPTCGDDPHRFRLIDLDNPGLRNRLAEATQFKWDSECADPDADMAADTVWLYFYEDPPYEATTEPAL